MKTADLKAGELYAVRRQYEPCLLLSTEVYRELQHSWSEKPDEYQPAPKGVKPRRDPSYASPTNYGFITLCGEADVLRGLDVDAALAALLADSRKGLPEGVSIEFVTSPAAFLGRYEAHLKVRELRLEAVAARRELERDRRLVAVARHNAAVRRLNVALGSESIRLAELDGYSEPTGVLLTPAQAERIADLLDTHDPEGPTS